MFTDKPDVYVTEFRNTNALFPFKFNSIENYILTESSLKGDVQINGYSSYDEYIKPKTLFFPYGTLEISSIAINKYKTDSLNYYIKSRTVKIDGNSKGYSGAPVFIKNIKSGKWRLLGMCLGSETKVNNNETRLVVCKIQYILSELDNFIKINESKKRL